MQQKARGPGTIQQGQRHPADYLCAAGGLQVPGGPGGDPGGGLCRSGLHGLLLLARGPVIADHSPGGALLGACSGS